MVHIDLKDDRSEKIDYDSCYPVYIRRGLLSSYPNYSAPSHWHDDIEMIYVLSGTMDYNVNGEIFTLNDGDGLFVNARQMHFGFSVEHNECDFLCVLIHPKLLCSVPGIEEDYVYPIVRNRSTPYVRLLPETPWQNVICRYIRQIYDVRETTASVMRVQGLFALIWAELLENLPLCPDTEMIEDRDLAIFKNMIGFIQTHYAEKMSLSQIAEIGSIGQSKCCKMFRKYLNQTPNEYLTEYRLNKSAEYLRNTDMTATEIAFTVGFGGGSYFAEAFRKWIGISPTEYRKH